MMQQGEKPTQPGLMGRRRLLMDKSRARAFMLGLLLPVLFATPGFGQHHDSAGDEKRATLMPGFGVLHHPVSTSNAEAQKFFEQGLALIYGFNHEEAARSFR